MVLKLARVDDWATFRTSNNAFANVVRLGIKPISYRKFDKTTGQWYVHKTQLSSLLGLTKKFFSDVDTTDIPQSWITGESVAAPDCYDALYITKQAPIQIVKAVYETLMLMYHPDHNDGEGNPARLQEVLKAYRTICKALKS